MEKFLWITGIALAMVCICWFLMRLYYKHSIMNDILAPTVTMLGAVGIASAFMAIFEIKYFFYVAPPVFILLFFTIRYINKGIIKPIITLTHKIDTVALGNTLVEIDKQLLVNKSEIGLISNALDQMIGNLKYNVNIANMVSK